MIKPLLCSLLFLIGSFAALAQVAEKKIRLSEDLEVEKLSDRVYVHISYLESPTFGRVACNGLIYINKGEALVMDTPVSNEQSQQLLEWLRQEVPGISIKGVIINHYHEDALGGLAEFHRQGIPSYAHKLTAFMAQTEGAEVPQRVFDKNLNLKVGNAEVSSRYFGEAHTKDNIVCWIPAEQVLFGGCMLKSMNASKGNISQANVAEWPQTVSRVKKAYPAAKIVVPGHGAWGGPELLDYTIKLFESPN